MPVRDLLMSASGASSPPVYVDDVFSTYLYTGTSATQSINNGIDLAGKGGMVWIKSRSAATNNNLFDTVQGATKLTHSNTTAATVTDANSLTAFSSTGFTLGTGSTSGNEVNVSSATYASWTFRKAPKFFDVVQFTGTGAAQAINHSLGSVPGCIIIKSTTSAYAWYVYHKGTNGGTNPQHYYTVLNTTANQTASTAVWNNTAPTSTQFTVGTNVSVNNAGSTYIAYIFADQAGGFGATGTDSAIACGNFAVDASGNATVNLGWEPQLVMIKCTDVAEQWTILDVMRGFSQTTAKALSPNLTQAENNTGIFYPTATGFSNGTNGSFPSVSSNYIYIAIRRPNKPPTTGSSVFSPNSISATQPQTVITNFPVDLAINAVNAGGGVYDSDRLRGSSTTSFDLLQTSSAAAEATGTGNGFGLDSNTTIIDNVLGSGPTSYWNFRRAPTFFDEVCYTGDGGTTTTRAHNLTVAPQLIFVKRRDSVTQGSWWTYTAYYGAGYFGLLNANAYGLNNANSIIWNNTSPTSTVFSIGNSSANTNVSGGTYVAYLFATCAGVSKVGSFTGTGGTQSIACGFGSGGARFILIKRADAAGDWYCYDSANGLTSSSSPYLLWDSTAAQVTGNNGVYASSGGFTLGATALLTTNIATATYIFLAIS